MTVTEVRRESVGEEKEALKVLDFKSIFFVLHLFLYNMVRLRTGCISVRRRLTSSSTTNLMTLLKKQLLKLSMKRYDGDGDGEKFTVFLSPVLLFSHSALFCIVTKRAVDNIQ